jgi:DNA-binding NarL/FixJ family response regulator
MIKVYLYGDEPVMAMGMEAVLNASGRFKVECFLSGLPDLLARLPKDAPDVLLLDVTPEVALSSLRDIREVAPECKVVIWVSSISTEIAFQAMGLGVRGILRKSLSLELHAKCVEKVQEGELWFEKALTESFLEAKRITLSQREGQLVTLLSYGLRNKEIASALQLTEGTVKAYLCKLYQKVGAQDRFELALFGVKNRLDGAPATLGEASQAIPSLRTMVVKRRHGPQACASLDPPRMRQPLVAAR